MSAATPEVFIIALQHHQAGRLPEAEALYRRLLAAQANHPGALHLLGVIALQSGHPEEAAKMIRQSVAIDPGNAHAHSNLGEACRALGRREEALACHRRAIELQGDFAQAHYNLAVVLAEDGHFDAAIEEYREALRLKPDYLEACNNLGNALNQQGLFAEAVDAFERALQWKPDAAPVWFNLGIALAAMGRLDDAVSACQRAIQLQPDHAESFGHLGNALQQLGRTENALAAFQRAAQLKPGYVEAHNNMGNALRDLGRLDEAIAAYQHALQLEPNFADVHYNLGRALKDQGRVEEAVAAYRRALALQHDHLYAHNNLGNALKEQGRLDEAIAAYRQALELDPDCAEAHNNLGNALRDQGQVDDALAAYRRALQLRSDDARVQSNLIYSLHFHPGQIGSLLTQEQANWNRQFGDPLKPRRQPRLNDRNPDRRLRVGYVSPDFRDHVVGRNLAPLFRCHDHARIEIVCYSGVAQPDSLTEQLRRHADQWRGTVGVSDEALAGMIREEGIDILVDLTQHMTGNRLLVFARQPAPVQVSFAGYPESTGLEPIGFRISDRWLESEMGGGKSEFGRAHGAELRTPNSDSEPALSLSKGLAEQVCLLDSFWCYDPCGIDVEVNSLPAERNGVVTFGSLNNFCKVNEKVLKLWARVLAAVADSRLLLLSPFGSHRQRALKIFEREGVESSRIDFVELRPRRQYFGLYHRVDIVLDPFPYGGHTTTLDALWMGVPVVSLAGRTGVSRGGLSILQNLGLPELVSFSEEDYLIAAVALARDLPRLTRLRATLRARLEASLLMDSPHFARQIEAAYRTMWRHWCAEPVP